MHAFLIGQAKNVVGGVVAVHFRHHETRVVGQRFAEMAGGVRFQVVVHLTAEHVAHFIQPLVELLGDRHQAAQLEQPHQRAHVRIDGVGDARVLDLEGQLGAVALAPGAMHLAQAGRAQGLRVHLQLGQFDAAQLLPEVLLHRRPFQGGGAVFQGVQRLGDLLGEEMLAEQRHHLADFHHRAL